MPVFPLAIRQSLTQHIRYVRWACLGYLAGGAVCPVVMGLKIVYLQSCIEQGVTPANFPFRETAAVALVPAATVLAWMCTLTRSALALGSFVAPALRWAVLLLVLLVSLCVWELPVVPVAERLLMMAVSLLTLVLLLYLSCLATAAGNRLLSTLAWTAAVPQVAAVPLLCSAELYANALTCGGPVLLWFVMPAGYLALWVWRMSGASSAILKADARLRFVAGRGRGLL